MGASFRKENRKSFSPHKNICVVDRGNYQKVLQNPSFTLAYSTLEM